MSEFGPSGGPSAQEMSFSAKQETSVPDSEQPQSSSQENQDKPTFARTRDQDKKRQDQADVKEFMNNKKSGKDTDSWQNNFGPSSGDNPVIE